MPRIVAVDTGPLVALFDRNEAIHHAAVQFFSRLKDRAVVTVPVITEVMHLLSLVGEARFDFLDCLCQQSVDVIDLQDEDWDRILQLMHKYADMKMDFADAAVVVSCERLATRVVATVDSDFDVYRYQDRESFINIFPRGKR